MTESKIDKEYKKKAPELFSKYIKARDLIDSWRGQRHMVDEAESLLSEIIEKDDKYAPAYREFGRFLILKAFRNSDSYRAGYLASAESSIKHAIKLSPKYADSYVLLGHLYTKMRRFSDAKKSLIMAQKLGTESPWLNNNWAEYYINVGNEQKAIYHYELIAHSNTSNKKAKMSAVEELAKLYSQYGVTDKALKLYEESVKLEPNSACAWGNYATQLLFNFGEVDSAIEKGEKALSIINYGLGRTTLASAYCTKWALTKSTELENAKNYFNKALSLVSDPNLLISKTIDNLHTNACAIELQRYLQATR